MLKSYNKKLTKLGGAYAMVIKKAILDLLDINVDENLSITLDAENKCIIIKKLEE
jgi:antitoxin component of MazEF toxin-antitoxin module